MLLAQVAPDASTFMELGKQVPSLMVLCVVVWMFLKSSGESRTEYLSSLKMMHDENVEARAVSREVIKDNTMATQDMTSTLHQLIKAVEAIERSK